MIDFERFLKQILDGYRASYDIEMLEEDESGLVATAVLHAAETQHFLFKEFQMSYASEDEYAYFFKVDKLTKEVAQACIDKAYALGFPQIDLDHTTFRKQHMCTRLAALVICDSADDDALDVIRKCRIYKSFQFSLKGWMEMHTVTVNLSDGNVVSNRYGRETAKFLKKHVAHYKGNVK